MKVKPYLVTSARYAISVSMIEAWNNCRIRGNEPEEPDIVASLVLNGTKIIENEWRNVFDSLGIRIVVTGIYCHQTPKVNFSGMKGNSCELGDLLWCHVHSDIDGNVIRNAILYQAKKSAVQPYKLRGNDKDQLKLYSTWPAFTYVTSGSLNGQTRHVKPSAPRRGAQYLLIDDRPPERPESGILGSPCTYPIGSCIPSNPIMDHCDLGLEIVHSLELLSGDPFDDSKTAIKENGWSRVVWDILKSSAEKAFRRANSKYGKQPRTTGASPSEIDGCFYATPPSIRPSRRSFLQELVDFSFSNNDLPPNRHEGQWNDEGGPGVSVLLLETYESGED
ncbi:MAG: hypothetical protein O8C66_01935 [Candidatus Methanoperedens sp.]|nr:hypothetical protein [Candidatus Methanoperedens sp.]MCZ7369245.1 hypothetical protein [Candidatus Methanoperedens sp.]